MNEYASWSIALRSMVKNQDQFLDYEIGKKSNGKPLKFREWLKIPNNYFKTHEILTGIFKETFKNVDLGGGDQTKILANNLETIEKYRNKIGVLTTAGSNEDRITKLIDLNKKLYDDKEQSIINTLDLDVETRLTAASYYEKAQIFLETFVKVCLIPIGSTDLHVIIYNKGGTVELHNISNYLTNESKINLSGINDTTLIVFAGSARYYLHQIYGVVSSDNSEEFTKAAEAAVAADKAAKEAVKAAKAAGKAATAAQEAASTIRASTADRAAEAAKKADKELQKKYDLTNNKEINLKKLIDNNINAKQQFGNKKIEEFSISLSRINFNYTDEIKIMISKGEDDANDVDTVVLKKCLDENVNAKKGGKNTKKKKKRVRRKKSRKRVKKNKRSTKKR